MISEKLNEAKKKKGLTNQKITELSGVPLSSVTRILNGETKDPAIDAVQKIATVLDVSLDNLYSDDILESESGTKYISERTFNLMLSEKNREIESARKEKRTLFTAMMILVGVLIVMILLDALNGRVGWIRYGETAREMIKGATQFFVGA